MKFSLGQVLEQFRSLRRFQVPVALVLLLAAVVNLEIAFVSNLTTLEAEAIPALIGAVLAALIFDLFAEGRRLSRFAKLAGALLFAAIVVALQMWHGKLYAQDTVVIGALVLGLVTAPYLRSDATNESMWNFDLQLGVAVAMGSLAVVIVCGGLSILFGSIQYLFDVHFIDRLYAHIWASGAALIGPLFALSMLPAQLDDRFTPSDSPAMLEWAVVAVLNFALAPLVLTYALMLHVYAAKIALTVTMPKGQIGWLVLAFGGIGTTAYMIAYQWRERGTRAVRWLVAGWFWAMMIPTLLLAVAVWERIEQHGVTPDRYCLCLFAIWMVAMAAYFGILSRRLDLRAIPISLGAALLLSSFGPWGAVAISTRSQLHQLYAKLDEHKLLDHGQLKVTPPTLETFNQVTVSNNELRSILTELNDLDALPRIAPLFASIADNPFKPASSDDDLQKALALGYHPEAPPPSVTTLELNLAHYDRMLGPIWIEKAGITASGPYSGRYPQAKLGQVPLTLSGDILTVNDNGNIATFDMAAAREAVKTTVSDQPLQIVSREGADRATMVAEPMWSGELLVAWLLLGRK